MGIKTITLRCRRSDMKLYKYGEDYLFVYELGLMHKTKIFYRTDNIPLNLLYSDVFYDVAKLRSNTIDKILE